MLISHTTCRLLAQFHREKTSLRWIQLLSQVNKWSLLGELSREELTSLGYSAREIHSFLSCLHWDDTLSTM